MLALLALAHATDASAGVHNRALARILEEHWSATLERSPVWATSLGVHTWDDRLDDLSPAALAASRRAAARWTARAARLDPAHLDAGDRLTRELFLEELRTSAAVDACQLETWNISARISAFAYAASLPEYHPTPGAVERASYLARVHALPRYVDTEIANLRVGLREGRTPNASSVRIVLDQVRAELARPAAELGPARPAAGWPAPDAAALVAAVDTEVRPAFVRYADFLERELLPRARPDERAGLRDLPGGDACYRALIRRHTTLDLAPEALHATGLRELERIHAEMLALGGPLLGVHDLPALAERLRTDPALRFSTEDEVEAKAEEALARAKAAMPRMFGRLPKADCVVSRVPPQEAPYTTIAYYWPAVPDGSKPGQYFVNTWAPQTRPRFEAEVLAWHEAIPGHHLQIALAQELPALPAFRRYGGTTAFVEGWGLYSERVAEEMGLYSGDLDRLGRASFDAWRASRLVVDTGLHAMGWTREQAVRFMLDNTVLAENNIRNEVDRYLTDPGQALAYKTGQLEISQLRAGAERELGARFDVRAFHDVVLGAGPVTLPVLDQRVSAWVAERLR